MPNFLVLLDLVNEKMYLKDGTGPKIDPPTAEIENAITPKKNHGDKCKDLVNRHTKFGVKIWNTFLDIRLKLT